MRGTARPPCSLPARGESHRNSSRHIDAARARRCLPTTVATSALAVFDAVLLARFLHAPCAPPVPIAARRAAAAGAPSRDSLPHGVLRSKPELFASPGRIDLAHVAVGLPPRQHDAFENRDARIAEDELLADRARRAEPAARFARAEGRVEREVSRLEFRQRDAAHRAAVTLRKHFRDAGCCAVVAHDFHQAFGQPQRRLD